MSRRVEYLARENKKGIMGHVHRMICILLGIISTLHFQEVDAAPGFNSTKPKLLYILLDGFRWDYLEVHKNAEVPTFKKILQEGVRAKWTNPIFPSLSYPSWTTLATGLYPENHNIIGNDFYDSSAKEFFSLSDSNTVKKPKWWTAEPIWTTAEKNNLKTAQIKWARCDVPIDNRVTTSCDPYVEEEYPTYNFLKNMLHGIQKLDEGYDFVQVYSLRPDLEGHKYGPEAGEVGEDLEGLDSVLDVLLKELEKKNLNDKVNIVIVSDHGMSDCRPEIVEQINLDDHLDFSLVEKITGRNAASFFYVPEKNLQEVYDQLSRVPGTSVYKKADIPEYYHYKSGKYAPDVLLVASQGYRIKGSTSDKQTPPGFSDSIGVHGYAPDNPDMRGIFFAKGPAFRKGVVTEPIDMVDVYQILTKVLSIEAQPHNGTWSHVEPVFDPSFLGKEPESSRASSSPALSLLVLVILSVLSTRM